MGKEATLVEEQIAILRNRGLELDFENEKVKEILLDIGYYRLGFYWNPFEKNLTHDFHESSKLSDVVTLYNIDTELRNLLNKFLNRIEINFRTSLIYYVSNKYKSSPTWFIDSNLMSNEWMKSIDKFYTKHFIKNNKPIKYHHDKYLNDKYAPAWKTLEFFSFGTIIKIYASLKDDLLKQQIAKLYGIDSVNKFDNHLKSFVIIRNICAHGGVLFDFKFPTGISFIPDFGLKENDRHSIHAVIKVMLFYLKKISLEDKVELESKYIQIMNKEGLSSKITDILASKSGFVS